LDKIKENSGLINGVYFAILTVVIGIVLYFISKPLFMNPSLRLVLSVALPVFFMQRAAKEERSKLDGYISFAEALQPAYICLIVGSVAFSLFQYIILNLDFELLEIQRTIAVESIQALSDFANLSEENVAAFEEIEAEDLKPNLQALVLGLAKNFILGFIIAAIVAAFVKRKNIASE
jgi:hypothetical protein